MFGVVSHQLGIIQSQVQAMDCSQYFGGRKRKASEAFEKVDYMGSVEHKLPVFQRQEKKPAKRIKLCEGDPMM